jgi:uncharacterized membrane protein YeaQ/YmgE (transglycosylase-associated protein family)
MNHFRRRGWLDRQHDYGARRANGHFGEYLVGIVGALIGGFLFNLLGIAGTTGFNLWTLLVAIIGAVVLLFVVGLVRRAA